MKYFNKLAVALSLLPIATGAGASQTGAGYISAINASADGKIRFTQSGTRNTPPTCGSTFSSAWGLDTQVAGGESLAAVILTAYALHKPINVFGTGDCSALNDTENVAFIAVDD